jgi:hypothetical protein
MYMESDLFMATKETITENVQLDFSNVEAYIRDGKYDFKITEQSDGVAENDNETPYIHATCEIINNAKYAGKKIQHTWWKTEKAMSILRNNMVAMGFDENELSGKVAMKKNFLVGRQFNGTVDASGVFPKIVAIRAIKA